MILKIKNITAFHSKGILKNARHRLSFGEVRVRPKKNSFLKFFCNAITQSITAIFIAANSVFGQPDFKKEIVETLRPDVLQQAELVMNQEPVTITSETCQRSAGGKHDFYSEGDYWWPDPEHPDGPYIQRDGQSNPNNFVAHRKAMIRFSQIIGALASAYVVTKNDQYVSKSLPHLKAWFIDTATMMNPSLLYAQAIKGRVTGRGIGIIDTIHLMEVAQGVRVMEQSPAFDKQLLKAIKDWFAKYLQWLTSHQYGKDEMNAENNHGTCWVMQVASFAKLTGNIELLNFCKERYKTVLLPNQMAADGSFPRELRRTKPYGYSLFNLDAMVTICHILSNENESLWDYQTQDGKSIGKAIKFLYPFVKSKESWPYSKDVMYWDNWPVAHPFLVMGAVAFQNAQWLETWMELNHLPQIDEVIRNLPVRNPMIWL